MRNSILLLISFIVLLCSPSMAEVTAVWSTHTALPGEKVLLFLVSEHSKGGNPERIQDVTPGRISNGSYEGKAYSEEPLQDNSGNHVGSMEICALLIETGRSGTVECNQLEISYSTGRREKVNVPPLQVYTTAKVEWRTVEDDNGGNNAADRPTSFGTFWQTSPQEYYTGQPVTAGVKLLLPHNFVDLTQLPQVVSAHVKTSQFHLPVNAVLAKKLQEWLPLRERVVHARGQKWHVLDLITTMIPMPTPGTPKTGDYDVYVSIPCSLRETHTISSNHGPGFSFSSTTVQAINRTLKLPKLALSTPRPLPPNPPADFSDLVGQFSISTTTAAKSLSMNEMIEVEMTIRGTGALEQLTCPQPKDAEHWKLMAPARRIISSPTGVTEAVVFTQLMRPIAEVSSVPSFSFSYFNDEEQEYKTAASAPIALPWQQTDAIGTGEITGEDAPPPAGSVPVAELTDIYHFMPNAPAGGSGAGISLPKELWYLLYLPGMGIFAWLIGRNLYKKWQQNATARMREKNLTALAKEQDSATFLKGIGAFIESNIPTAKDTPHLQAILDKRDSEVFRPDATPSITPEEKAGILRTVRKAISGIAAVLMLLCMCSQLSHATEDAAMQAYDAGQYSKALSILEQDLQQNTPERDKADTLYNIGNCYYRLGKPGNAALFYARALRESPGFAEAEANLAFIQRKEGAILPQLSTTDEVFTYLSKPQLWLATVICSAALLLSCALATWLQHRYRTTIRTAIGISLALTILCAAGHVYYFTRTIPDITATPPDELAYITTATTARSAATDSASAVTELPASTPVRILATRGARCYVETFTGVRGWIPATTATTLEANATEPAPTFTIRFR